MFKIVPSPLPPLALASILGCSLVAITSAAITPASLVIIDASFNDTPDGIQEDFSLISNSIGNPSWDNSNGQATLSTDQNSSGTVGCVSDHSFDGSQYAVITASFVIESIIDPDGQPTHNGHWVGLTGNNSELWNNSQNAGGVDGWALGIRFLGGTVNFVYDNASGNEIDIAPLGNFDVSSLQDGYTVDFRFTPSGWEVCLIGITGSVDAQGSWPANFDFSTLTNDPSVFASSTYQQGNEADTVIHFTSISVNGDSGSDSDNDGMPDNYEATNGLNPNLDDAALDNDASGGPDGLTNLEEYQIGTDPQNSDSDNDGLLDGQEVNGTLNPWSAGLQSTPPGDPTNPLNPDSDGDSVSDNAEILAGTDPNRRPPDPGPNFPFVDSDGDGYRDDAELAFGSNPSDASSIPDHRPPATKPNIVIIYADDLGFGDISAYGNLFGTNSPALTPNIDSISADGVTFTQGHSGNAVCTPSRYALLTGRYNWREFDGITSSWGGTIGGDELPRVSDVTIAEFLKTQQYDTAAFGKWHLGGAFYQRDGTRITGNPRDPNLIDWERRVDLHAVDHGFDHFRGNAVAINFVPYVYLIDDRMQFWDTTLNGGSGAYRPALNTDLFRDYTQAQINAPVLGQKGSRDGVGDPSYNQNNVGPQLFSDVENFLADRATSGDPDPFFAYVAMHSPHKPWALTAEFVGDGVANGFLYADWMREVDDRVGRVLTALEDNGFDSNTIVIFTSDNGPEVSAMADSIANNADSNGPLRGNKRDSWDGGTRVPFMIRWPGQAAAGIKIDHPIWQGDIFATIAAYLNAPIPDSTAPDGESFLNLLRGQQKPSPQRKAFVMSSISGHLGLKTIDGWKFIDSTGGGGSASSWDSSNVRIPSPIGIDQGSPKQLFHQSLDLGENSNLIAGLTSDSEIRNQITSLAGEDLLGLLDQLRNNLSTSIYPRIPDNDGDLMPNSYETSNGLDPDWPLDADGDLDSDGASNLAEFIAGTDPADSHEVLHISAFNLQNNNVEITWPSISGRSYHLASSSDLISWSPVRSVLGTGTDLNLTIDLETEIAGDLEKLFFRIEVTLAE